MVALEKATYGRHDKKGIEKFREHVVVMLENLLGWPQVAGLREEPFPAKTAQRVPGWTFHKLEFSCPRANGNQRQGRLMILANLAERLIRPVYIYTHAQFPGRVPNDELKDLIVRATAPKTATQASVTSGAEGATAPEGATSLLSTAQPDRK